MPRLGCAERCPWTGFLAALALLALAAPPASAADLPGSLALEGVHYVSSRDARTEMRLDAARARYAPDAGRVLLEDVQLEVAAGPGVVGFALRCERGSLDLDGEVFVAEGRVRAQTRDGRELRTEALRYEHRGGVVSSQAPVRIEQGGALMSGGGFRYDVRSDHFVLRGGAAVVQQP